MTSEYLEYHREIEGKSQVCSIKRIVLEKVSRNLYYFIPEDRAKEDEQNELFTS